MSPEARRPTTVTSSPSLSAEDPAQPSEAKAAFLSTVTSAGPENSSAHIRLMEPVWAGHSSGLPHEQVSLWLFLSLAWLEL